MTNKTVAIEIYRQLGGNRFKVMTGASNFACDNNMFICKIPMKKDRISHIKITLNAMDTYDIDFISAYGGELKTISRHEGIYCDMLQDVVSSRTGLALQL